MQFGQLTILCACIFGVLGDPSCSRQEDCSDPDRMRCSICVDDPEYEGNGVCVALFPNIFQNPPKCSASICNLNCGIRGVCQTPQTYSSSLAKLDYHSYCWCKLPYYGRDCKKIGGEEVPRLVKKQFGVMAGLGEPTPLVFEVYALRSKEEFKGMQFYLKHDGWIYHEQPTTKSSAFVRGEDITRTYYLDVLFPYKPPANPTVYTFRNNAVGYKTNLSIRISIYNKWIFKETYDMFVNYEEVDFNCFPKIEFMNCAASLPDSVPYTRDSHVLIPVTVDYRVGGGNGYPHSIDKKCDQTGKMTLKIWKLIETFAYFKPDYVFFTNIRNIHFIPFSLEFGSYLAKLEVTAVNLKRSISSVNSCFFNIICKPLVVTVLGGTNRMISANFGLLLKVGKAFDPNMPPDNQDHITIEWSCSDISELVCQPKRVEPHQFYFIPNSMLTAGAEYHFTIRAWTDRYVGITECEPANMAVSADVRIKVANESEANGNNFAIECFLNCGTKVEPNRELFLKAISFYNNQTQVQNYEWTYFEGSEVGESVDSIKVDGLPSYMLLLKEGTLKVGTNYTIVAGLSNSDLFASFSFETDRINLEVDCTVNPNSGTKGLTRFQIQCELNNIPLEETLRFEFYDKNDNEANDGFVFSGRMLGASTIGELTNVCLTRGNVMVYILNARGLYLTKTIKVELSAWNIDDSVLMGLYQNIIDEQHSGSFTSSLMAISFIPDIIPESMEKNKSEILNKLVGFLSEIPVEGTVTGQVKLWASSINNILLTLNSAKLLTLETPLLLTTIQLINRNSKLFSGIILSRGATIMPPNEIRQVILSLLNSMSIGLLSRDRRLDNVDEESIDGMLLNQLNLCSRDIEEILEHVANILSYVQAPAQPATRVSSSDNIFVVCVMEDDALLNLTDMLSMEKDINFEVAQETQVHLNSKLNKKENLALQLVFITENIFWWTASEVKSELVFALIKRRHLDKFQTLKYIQKPVTVLFDMPKDLTPSTFSGVTTQLDPSSDITSLDLDITFHRLDLEPGSIVSVRFLFPNTNGSLRVFARDLIRPDYKMMTEKAIDINDSSPAINIVKHQFEERFFIFMGILPGHEVAVNQSVVYAFELNSTLCQAWEFVQWSTAGCRAVKIQSPTQVRCDCTHFSIFAAAFPVPPNEINPYNDVTLFLTVYDNPMVVIVVTSILLAYTLFCAFLWFDDRRTRRRRTVILLEDNFPSDKHPCLVAVYTSSRFNAGTTAHVGITVVGSESNSRRHILSCEKRKVLQSNSDDWFIILTPEPLGEVESLHLWHDNYGSSPKWHCNKIIVYDLVKQTETLFTIDEWLSVQESEHPEMYVLPAAEEDLKNIKSLFIDNFIFGLMENHVFMSVITSHPRSGVSKIQRLSVLLCYIMVAMLCSIMFYISGDNFSSIDSYGFSIGAREIIVSIQSVIVSIIVTSFVIFSFKRSYKYAYVKQKSTLKLRRSHSTEPQISIKKVSAVQSLYSNYVNVLSKILKARSMRPVELLHSDSAVKVQLGWLISAWTYCVSVILICAYLVMLYGLKLGAVKSQVWLVSVLISMVGEIFIYAPVRIVLMSTLMTMAVQKMYDVNTHRVAVDDLRSLKIRDDIAHIFRLIERRKHDMYNPMNAQQRNKILQRKRLRLKWWALVDFIISAMFAVVLSNVIFQLWSSYYNTNTHVTRLATAYRKYLHTNGQFFSAYDVWTMEEYLKNTLVNVVYNTRWYQGSPVDPERSEDEKKYWSADYTHRTLGVPQVRQLRAVYRPCGAVIGKTGKCVPPWSHSTEDKDIYGEHWGPWTWSDVAKVDSPWVYTVDREPLALPIGRLYGPSGTYYTRGGYVARLDPSRRRTELRLVELRHNDWLDLATRAVFVEFTLCNVNEHLYIQVTLVLEYLAAGAALQGARATTVSTSIKHGLWSVMFVFFICLYISRSIYLMNNYGLLRFLSRLSNVLRLVIVFLGLLSVLIFTVHLVVSSEYSETFQSSGLDNYFDFDRFRKFFVVLKYVVPLLKCFVILHTILLLKAGRRLYTHVHTFKASLNWIFWSAVATSIILLALNYLSTSLRIGMHCTRRDLLINKQSLKYITGQESGQISVISFVIIKTVFIGAILWLFVVQFRYYVNEAKFYKLRKYDTLNFVTFLVDQFNIRR